MDVSGSTSALERLPGAEAPAVAQFHSEPQVEVTRAAQRPNSDKPLFEHRTQPAGTVPAEVSFGRYRLLPMQFLLLEGDKPVPLGSRALEMLIALIERQGELVSKEDLTARVWPNLFVDPSNLTVHMSALRRALRDGQDGNRFIINIKGRGYRFVASVDVSGREN
jgi:DNA-binding winged helix-turn-helix (wHTH) protein